MAKRVRDHKAENARRNELARLRGETNRYQLRRKIETGLRAPIDPKRVRSPKTIAAQKRMLTSAPRGKGREYYAPGVFVPKISDEDRAADWSAMFARSDAAVYKPEEARSLGMTRKEYRAAYLRAFVLGDTRYDAVRHAGGSPHLYYWFVTMHHYFSADEYESRYGPAS